MYCLLAPLSVSLSIFFKTSTMPMRAETR